MLGDRSASGLSGTHLPQLSSRTSVGAFSCPVEVGLAFDQRPQVIWALRFCAAAPGGQIFVPLAAEACDLSKSTRRNGRVICDLRKCEAHLLLFDPNGCKLEKIALKTVRAGESVETLLIFFVNFKPP